MKKYQWLVTIITGCCIIFSIGLYFWHFRHGSLSNETSDWGAFGDYLAGVFPTLLAVINILVWVMITHYQTVKARELQNDQFMFQSIDRIMRLQSLVKCPLDEREFIELYKACSDALLWVKSGVFQSLFGEIPSNLVTDCETSLEQLKQAYHDAYSVKDGVLNTSDKRVSDAQSKYLATSDSIIIWYLDRFRHRNGQTSITP